MLTSDYLPVSVFACALWPDPAQSADAYTALPWLAALQSLEHKQPLQQLAAAGMHLFSRLPPDSACSSHEWAYALAAGWPENPGLLPFAAQAAQQLQLRCPPDHGWAFVDLVHGQFNQGHMHISLPGSLSDTKSEGFLHAMQPYFEEDGISLQALSPGRFLAHSPLLKALPAVSLDLVLQQGTNALAQAEPLATQSPAQRLLRRLQNEMQMLFYTHALNEQRAKPVNSFWLSGSGDLPARANPGVILHTGLRDSFLAQDTAVWARTWLKLAEQAMLPALEQGHALVLCGPQRCLRLQAGNSNWLQNLTHKLFTPSLTRRLS